MGHGSAIPYELFIGSGNSDLLAAGIDVLDRLILQHRRFVYVPSNAANRLLLSIGDALEPLEYAVVDTLHHSAVNIVRTGHHYRGRDWRAAYDRALEFAETAGRQVVAGVYRASRYAPA